MADAQKTVEAILQTLIDNGTEYGMSVLGAVVILILGWWFAGWAKRAVTKALDRVKSLDDTLTPFLSSLVRYVILAFVVVAVLNQFGVQTTSIIAVLGAAGLAIGLALQGTLQNVAAGVMLLVLRPFKAGDFIDAAGQAGTVVEIGLFTTELKTPDGIFKSVPNSSLWNATITNFSRNSTRRIDFVASISYGDDLPGAMELLKGMLDADPRILKDPAPEVMTWAMAASSVDINLRAWVATADYWPTLFDLRKTVKLGLEQAGFTIPFPQQDVHMHQVPAKAAE
ncbi:MAG: mechanosensitive ion channel protein MscS [Rhodospirillales bacterium CG15_BIG_FIL_POST_REV_8_21_14_020_66_15]|nr:MAG: mechanosensitive ion channel protein MscS [Rhodospirillales bacterium CG15_BIG_FIL_POST_REV_8_21_14_020_66_15]